MASLLEQKCNEIARILQDDPAEPLALTLVTALSHLSMENTSFLSYRSLGNLVGAGGEARDLLQSIAVLASPKVNILAPMFVYAPEEGREHVLTRQQWSEAKREGFLVDPDTGSKIDNFEELVFPYFATTADFARMVKQSE